MFRKLFWLFVTLCTILIVIKLITINRIEHFRNKRGFRIPKFKIPNIKIPNIKIPNIKIPNIKTPNIKIPNIQTPNIKIPNIQTPSTYPVPHTFKPVQNTKNELQTVYNNVNRSAILFSPTVVKAVEDENDKPLTYNARIQPHITPRCNSSTCVQKNTFDTVKTDNIKGNNNDDIKILNKVVVQNNVDAKKFKVNGNNLVHYDKQNNKLIFG